MCHTSDKGDFKSCPFSLNGSSNALWYWACATSHLSAATNVIIVSLPRLPSRYRVARTAFLKPRYTVFVQVVALSWINASRIFAMRLKRNGKRAWLFSILFPVFFFYLFIFFRFLWTRSISVVNTRATWCGLKLRDIMALMEGSRATTVRSNKWR